MGDDYLEKFRLTAEHKKIMKEAFSELIERQFEAMGSAYMDIFRGLPGDVAESMSPQEASELVGMVVKEAAANITNGAALIQKEAAKVVKDDAKMAEIRKKFLESLVLKETKE